MAGKLSPLPENGATDRKTVPLAGIRLRWPENVTHGQKTLRMAGKRFPDFGKCFPGFRKTWPNFRPDMVISHTSANLSC